MIIRYKSCCRRGDRTIHKSLNLALRSCGVPDADVVDVAVEIIVQARPVISNPVANLEGCCRIRKRSGLYAYQLPVFIKSKNPVIVGSSHVGPNALGDGCFKMKKLRTFYKNSSAIDGDHKPLHVVPVGLSEDG